LITQEDIQKIPEAEFYNLEFTSAKAVSTDSRTASRGDIFFALRGDKFDGHDFVGHVIKKKAACAVVDRKWYGTAVGGQLSVVNYPLVVVDDTTRALGELARIFHRKFSMPVIAVGGSNGKTTTKEMIAKVMSKKFKVVKTAGNHNNQIGVPLTIFQFDNDHEAAVVEIGTNHPGEIEQLCEILEPTAGILTNIGAEHLEFFKNLNGVKKEEGKLFKYLASTKAMAFVNVDDRNLADLSQELKHKFTFGFGSNRKHFSGRLFGMDNKGCAIFEMRYKNRTDLVHLHAPGIHNAMNALAAAAVGAYYGVKLDAIKNALESYQSYEKRMQIIKAGSLTILNDTYNSNPESAMAAIRWLSMVHTNGKRIAVLADMLELGKSAKREHQKIGKEIARMSNRTSAVSYLFTLGNLAREIAVAADSKVKAKSFDDKNKLSEKLLQTVSAEDVVLVKGSRGMKMEDVVDTLLTKFKGQE